MLRLTLFALIPVLASGCAAPLRTDIRLPSQDPRVGEVTSPLSTPPSRQADEMESRKSNLASDFAIPDLSGFPKSLRGKVRHVVVLTEEEATWVPAPNPPITGPLPPHKEKVLSSVLADAGPFVEIRVGMTVATDGVNQGGLSDTTVKPVRTRAGLSYYVVSGTGEVTTTLRGVPPGTPTVDRFWSVPPIQVRYDRKRPVVFYVPPGYEVRYRIWAGPGKPSAGYRPATRM